MYSSQRKFPFLRLIDGAKNLIRIVILSSLQRTPHIIQKVCGKRVKNQIIWKPTGKRSTGRPTIIIISENKPRFLKDGLR